MTKTIKFVALIATLALNACGQESNDTAAGGNAAQISKTSKQPPKDWNAEDACAVINKGEMAAFIGQPVKNTRLGLVSTSDGATAATSECTYEMADNTTAALMLRWSPIGDNSEGSINLTRNGLEQTLKRFGGSVEDVDDLGRAAFWVGATNALNVFIGDDKFAIITVPAGPAAKDQAAAIARKLGA